MDGSDDLIVAGEVCFNDAKRGPPVEDIFILLDIYVGLECIDYLFIE